MSFSLEVHPKPLALKERIIGASSSVRLLCSKSPGNGGLFTMFNIKDNFVLIIRKTRLCSTPRVRMGMRCKALNF